MRLKSHTSSHASSLLEALHRYNILRNDHLHKGRGGVAIYFKLQHCGKSLHSSDTSVSDHLEYMFIDLKLPGTNLILAVCYRPPKIGFTMELERILLQYLHLLTQINMESLILN